MNAYTDALIMTLFPRASRRDSARREVTLDTDGLDRSLSVLAYHAVNAVASGFSTASAAVRRWHLQRQTLRELSALDDRQLWDIGLTRGDVRAVAEGLVSRDTGRQSLAA